jgi:drug/metabolite transporter (DMT)-like permease
VCEEGGAAQGGGTVERAEHRLGVALVCASAVPFAMAGIFTRLIQADLWTVLVWRGLIGGVLIFAYARLHERGLAMGWRGWTLAVVGGMASIAFLAAFRMTFVANVTLIYAMAPFAAAGLDRLIRGEKVRPEVLRAALLSVAGVVVIVGGGLGGVHLAGDFMALLMMGLFALYTVLIRAFPGAPLLTAAALSSLPPVAIGLVLGAPLSVGHGDVARLALFGLSFALAVVLFTEGARRTPAAEAGLYGGLEVPLAVGFAWLWLVEAPPALTLVGGVLVMGAVVWRGWRDLSR